MNYRTDEQRSSWGIIGSLLLQPFYDLIVFIVVGWRRISGAHQPAQSAPHGMKQLYLTDSDGYFICFQWKT